MDAFRSGFHWLRTTLAIALLAVSVLVPTANAGMVSTDALAQQQTVEDARSRIHAALDRDDVRAQLLALGVDPADAQARVAALTDAEAQQLAAEMDQLPAGGASVIGAAVFVFLVLLFTDIMGWTNVFPFVNSIR
jgi:hypothetical protein